MPRLIDDETRAQGSPWNEAIAARRAAAVRALPAKKEVERRL
jgi:hypothetical protein